jgi:hypothetical protein
LDEDPNEIKVILHEKCKIRAQKAMLRDANYPKDGFLLVHRLPCFKMKLICKSYLHHVEKSVTKMFMKSLSEYVQKETALLINLQ